MIALLAALLFVAPRSDGIEAPLHCSFVKDSACGCVLVVRGRACPAGGGHFVHELADGAPLVFDDGQGAIEARSRRPARDSFSWSAGDAWEERYDHADGGVTIRYRPGGSTCVEPDAEIEPCEYFDVEAEVIMQPPQGAAAVFDTAGRCGC